MAEQNYASIPVRGKLPTFAKIGTKAYVVRLGGERYSPAERTFTTICPVCDDQRELEIRGFRFPCPKCRNKNSSGWTKDDTKITIRHYVVEEYIVNKLIIEGPEYKNCYNKSGPTEGNEPFIREIGGFCRHSNAIDGVKTRHLPVDAYHIDKTPEQHKERPEFTRLDEMAWTSAKAAEAFCKMLNQEERDKLAAFNEAYGTNHEYPWISS